MGDEYDDDPIIARRRKARQAAQLRIWLILCVLAAALIALPAVGFGVYLIFGSTSSGKHRSSAREYIRGLSDDVAFVRVEGPELVTVTRHPQSFGGIVQDVADQRMGTKRPPAKPAKSVVRVVFWHTDHTRHGGRFKEDWLVWLDEGLNPLDFSDNPGGDGWRAEVRRLADR